MRFPLKGLKGRRISSRAAYGMEEAQQAEGLPPGGAGKAPGDAGKKENTHRTSSMIVSSKPKFRGGLRFKGYQISRSGPCAAARGWIRFRREALITPDGRAVVATAARRHRRPFRWPQSCAASFCPVNHARAGHCAADGHCCLKRDRHRQSPSAQVVRLLDRWETTAFVEEARDVVARRPLKRPCLG